MSKKDVLSQEEIDALLNNVGNEDAGDEAAATGAVNEENMAMSNDGQGSPESEAGAEAAVAQEISEEIKIIDFANQERIVRGRLPVIDKVNERAARFFAMDIYQLMSHEIDIDQQDLSIMNYAEFMSHLNNPSLIQMYRFRPLRGKAMIIFDPLLVYEMVDHYFGGSGQFNINDEKLDFTPTEMRIMTIICDALSKNIEHAWAHIVKLGLNKVGDETNPQLVNICAASELVLVSKFDVSFFDKQTGSYYIVIPYAMVEPIKQQLELGTSTAEDDVDLNWITSLKEELMNVPLAVSSTLGRGMSTLKQIHELKKDDFIPLEMNETVSLDIEGVPCFRASVGTRNDKAALKIIKKIEH